MSPHSRSGIEELDRRPVTGLRELGRSDALPVDVELPPWKASAQARSPRYAVKRPAPRAGMRLDHARLLRRCAEAIRSRPDPDLLRRTSRSDSSPVRRAAPASRNGARARPSLLLPLRLRNSLSACQDQSPIPLIACLARQNSRGDGPEKTAGGQMKNRPKKSRSCPRFGGPSPRFPVAHNDGLLKRFFLFCLRRLFGVPLAARVCRAPAAGGPGRPIKEPLTRKTPNDRPPNVAGAPGPGDSLARCDPGFGPPCPLFLDPPRRPPPCFAFTPF